MQLIVIGQNEGQVAVCGLIAERGKRGLFEQGNVEGKVEGGFEVDHVLWSADFSLRSAA